MYSMCTCNIYLKQLIITIHLVYEKYEGKWKEKKIEKKSEKKIDLKLINYFLYITLYFFLTYLNLLYKD